MFFMAEWTRFLIGVDILGTTRADKLIHPDFVSSLRSATSTLLNLELFAPKVTKLTSSLLEHLPFSVFITLSVTNVRCAPSSNRMFTFMAVFLNHKLLDAVFSRIGVSD